MDAAQSSTVSSQATSDTGLAERPKASLSPSRAGDFMTCPQLYRYRSIDMLPEPPGREAARGTLVHEVLEQLFDLPAQQRTPESAVELLPALWQTTIERSPELPGLIFGDDDAWHQWQDDEVIPEFTDGDAEAFLQECTKFLGRYFELEDPTRLEPAEREQRVSVELPSGLVLRGIIDRVDRAPNGAVRVVDYKTGRAPGSGWEAKALFQMRFYGLMLWRLTGVVPTRLQLLYLGSKERLSIDPTEQELRATESKIEAIWQAIERAIAKDDWPAKPSRLCDWCSFKSICPAWQEDSD